jgi:TfoX/Sxy family transcriptional regulator of competence genes
MTDAGAQFTTIAETLGGEVTRRQMMGCPILMREGKMVACLDKDVFGSSGRAPRSISPTKQP